jgi:hypothetical protein
MNPFDQNEGLGGKVALFIASGVIGLFFGEVAYHAAQISLLESCLAGLLAAIVNPFLARVSVAISQALYHAAFPDTYSPWTTRGKAWVGAFWPITLPFWIVIFVFFVSINRLFRSQKKAR